MAMTLRQLEFLVGIADLGSISACAEYYGVTQPAVTNQIHLLEEELSAGLIIRRARGATLTDIGQKTVRQAKKVLQEAKQIAIDIEESKQTITGNIVLGVSPLSPVSIHHFPRIYRPFHKAFPDIHIEVVEIEARHLAEQVCNNRVGLALTPLPLFTMQALYEPLWTEELVVISNPEENLPDPLPIALLCDYDFVFMKPGYSLNLTVARLAQETGFEPHTVAEASTINSLLGFVAAGIGVAIVPAETVILEAKAGLVNISRLAPRAYRQLAMVFRSREDLTPTIKILMHYVRSYSDDIPLNHLHHMTMPFDGPITIPHE